ncbi:MAG: hypothetical protein ACOY4N_10950 [Pseudomonadota bacterium]|uniref:hypothetical protein n=1 Tax=Sphingobium xenophagum TaxID=121428 RepID=UPI0036D210B1|tara:strand:+ start:602 stop:778 length:177 start_codon:yes stop_codon:yes gene_type:complete
MKVTVWINPDDDEPFGFHTEVADEMDYAKATADAFNALHEAKPRLTMTSAKVLIEQNA